MKTQKLNQKTIVDAGIAAAGLVVGVALSGAIGNVVKDYVPENEEIAKVGIAGVGLAGAALVSNKDQTGMFVQSVGLGVAAKQGYDLASNAIKSTITVKENPTLADKAIYGAVGLGCPGEGRTFLAASAIHFPQNDVLELSDPDWNGNTNTNKKSILA